MIVILLYFWEKGGLGSSYSAAIFLPDLSLRTLESFPIHKITSCDFDWNCFETTDHVGKNWRDNIESLYSWTWNICLFSILSSSEFCSFLCISFLHISLDLYLSISLGMCQCKWYVLLISNATCSLLGYRKQLSFVYQLCILRPCYNCLAKGFFSQFYIDDHVIYEQRQLYVFLSFPFPFFSSIIALAGTSNAMLKRSSEKWHSYLVSYLNGKASNFLPLNMMWPAGFL